MIAMKLRCHMSTLKSPFPPMRIPTLNAARGIKSSVREFWGWLMSISCHGLNIFESIKACNLMRMLWVMLRGVMQRGIPLAF